MAVITLVGFAPVGAGYVRADSAVEEEYLTLTSVDDQLPWPSSEEEIRRRGLLRIFFYSPDGRLPAGSSQEDYLRQASNFAAGMGLVARLLYCSDPMRLLDELRLQRADLLVTPLQLRQQPGIKMINLSRRVRLLVVDRPGRPGAPDSLRRLAEEQITLAGTPQASWIEERLGRLLGKKRLQIVVARGQDELQLLQHLKGPAVVNSDSFQEFISRGGAATVLFVLDEQLPLGWALSEKASWLAGALEKFFTEQEMNRHLGQKLLGDLDEITSYGALRVVLQNNAVSYYVYRGQQVGFQYEISDELARRLGLRLEVVVPRRPADTLKLLIEGRADLAVTSVPDDQQILQNVRLSSPFHWSNQVLVQPAGEEPVEHFSQLMWRKIHVRRSSQYWPTVFFLSCLIPFFRVEEAGEDFTTDKLIDLVGRGQLPLTVSNSVLLAAEMFWRSDVRGTLILDRRHPLVFATRNSSIELARKVEEFVKNQCKEKWIADLEKKYFETGGRMAEARPQAFDVSGAISPYDEIIKKHAASYGLDWRLVAALIYQESSFNPRAQSPMGALGLMQLMPATARELGVRDPLDPEENIRGGVAYLAWLIDRFEPQLSRRQKLRFALAAYNSGLEHVRDARQLAWQLGLDANRWFQNVEKAMLYLERPDYYQKVSYGYARGRETVAYVSRIQQNYQAYCRMDGAAKAQE